MISPRKSRSERQTISRNCKGKICELLHDRFAELLPLGLKNIFFPVRGDNLSLLATALGYDAVVFLRMASVVGLIGNRSGSPSIDDKTWETKLRHRITLHNYSGGG